MKFWCWHRGGPAQLIEIDPALPASLSTADCHAVAAKVYADRYGRSPQDVVYAVRTEIPREFDVSLEVTPR